MVPTLTLQSQNLSQLTTLQESPVITNSGNTVYNPKFFSNEEFGFSRVIYNTFPFQEADIEDTLLSTKYSFAFLRDGELRTIEVYDANDIMLPFEQFCSRMNISINTSNIFKAGKYLSRIFRPVRYGKFFQSVDVHINNNPAYSGSITDGLLLISLNLAKSLGWKGAKPNMSAQFTLLNSQGLSKVTVWSLRISGLMLSSTRQIISRQRYP